MSSPIEAKARIEEIRLQNFRAFENARLSLADLTFLVGRNGAGKSSLLDAVEFFREALTDSLPNALNRRDGFEAVFRKGAPMLLNPMGLAVVLRVPLAGRDVRVLYGFELWPGPEGISIREALRVSPGASLGFVRTDNDAESEQWRTPPAVPKNRLLLPLVVSNDLWRIAYDTLSKMRAYEISPHAVASPAPIGNTTTLARDGSNAGDVIEDVETRRDAYERLVGTMEAVLPGITRVSAGLTYGRHIVTFVQRIGGQVQAFNAGQMSQGTLRALGVLLALHQHPRPSLVLVDEIEDSIHPRALDAILEAVEEHVDELPLVLTTHSPEVLSKRQVTPERVRIVQWEDGVTRLYPLSEGTRASVDPVTTVGDLLRFNALWPGDAPDTFQGELLELGA